MEIRHVNDTTEPVSIEDLKARLTSQDDFAFEMSDPPLMGTPWEWFKAVVGLHLIRKFNRPAFWRVVIYTTAVFISLFGMSYTTGGSMTYGAILLNMLVTAVYFLAFAAGMDSAERSKRWARWEHAERRRIADAYVEHCKKKCDDFKLGMIESIMSKAMEVRRDLEKEARRIHGEDWKDKGDKPNGDQT